MVRLSPVLAYLAAISLVFAHPGHNLQEEAAERADFLKFEPRSIRSCGTELQKRGHLDTALIRRGELARKAQESRGLIGKPLMQRDFSEYNISHASTSDISFGDDEMNLFSDNSSCILQPEVTQGMTAGLCTAWKLTESIGPYYVDGELIRSNVTDGQGGVPLYLDIQFVDTALVYWRPSIYRLLMICRTCEPVPAVYIDIWHCNSTGVYSGVSSSGNGNSNDTSNLDKKFLRGLQQTDANGVVQFETIFPGHYTGKSGSSYLFFHDC